MISFSLRKLHDNRKPLNPVTCNIIYAHTIKLIHKCAYNSLCYDRASCMVLVAACKITGAYHQVTAVKKGSRNIISRLSSYSVQSLVFRRIRQAYKINIDFQLLNPFAQLSVVEFCAVFLLRAEYPGP